MVRVTRRGQTTIPIEFRRRLQIQEGSWLVVEARGGAITMRPVPDLEDLARSMTKISNRRKANALLDRMERDEE